MEEWRDIKGYEGLYQVSNKGRVKALDREVICKNGHKYKYYEHIMKNTLCQGYYYVGLNLNNTQKRKRVHRLVAEAFIPNPNGYKEINHKDENPRNNRVENIEWCDRSYNINYGTRNEKVGEHYKKKVCMLNENGDILEIYNSLTEASEKSGAMISSISSCCNNRYKSAGGYKWKYYE